MDNRDFVLAKFLGPSINPYRLFNITQTIGLNLIIKISTGSDLNFKKIYTFVISVKINRSELLKYKKRHIFSILIH